jgi:non-heme chloroperoxidase
MTATRTSFVTTKDGAEIFFKDWGSGRPIVFSHGWPLNADIWDDQLLYFSRNGFRAVATDRRGHGRSSQTSGGNDMNTYADDLAAVIEALDLRDIVLVGHSTGGGEVARYIGRHGTSRVAKVVLVSAVTPQFAQSPTNPDGAPMAVIEGIRQGLLADHSQFYRDLSLPFFSYNREGAKVSEGIRDTFWRLSMQAGLKGAFECTWVWEEDHVPDLQKFDVPTLVIHGSDDQIVPIDGSAKRVPSVLPGAILKIYDGAPHGLTVTLKDRFNQDLLEFATATDAPAPRPQPVLAAALS